jgi:hypothetical protein
LTKKIFDPGKYDMEICPCCNGNGFIQTQNVNVAQSVEALGSLKREWDKRKIVIENPIYK